MNAAPNGTFADGLILFGSLEKGGCAAKGYVLQPPDLRGAACLIQCLPGQDSQLAGERVGRNESATPMDVYCDYKKELSAYFRETKRSCIRISSECGRSGFNGFGIGCHRRELRAGKPCALRNDGDYSYSGNVKSHDALLRYYEKLLGQLRGQFDELTARCERFSAANTPVTPMGDIEHYVYCKKFLTRRWRIVRCGF